jgi:4-amino-4-deoxy-L-arabinose transferase-like glycosyltransferase
MTPRDTRHGRLQGVASTLCKQGGFKRLIVSDNPPPWVIQMTAEENRDRAGDRLSEGGGFGLTGVIVLYLTAVAIVNPFRECPMMDDWAYGQTVWHFVETGQYKLHEWLSANIPFQALWGAVFCGVFGNTFTALRLSTIVLAIVGLVSLYGLAREHGLGRHTATLVTLCVASSAIFFWASMTFLTDVPFLATLLVAIWAYTRAVRRMTWRDWGAASLVGACPILTRQFGVALAAAVGLLAIFGPWTRGRMGRYAVGLALPCLATAWQVDQGWFHSNWAALFNLHRQRLYFWSPGFVKNIPWRPAVVTEYVAFMLIPLVIVAAIAAARELAGEGSRQPIRRVAGLGSIVGWLVFFSLATVYGWKLLRYPPLMPFLSDRFDLLYNLGTAVRWSATIFTIVGAALFARNFVARYFGPAPPVDLKPPFDSTSSARPGVTRSEAVLDLTTLFLLVQTVVFVQLWDEYLLVYLPYAAIAVSRQIQPVLRKQTWLVVGLCTVLLAGAGVWTREELCRSQAMWTLAQRVRQEGVAPRDIFCDWGWIFFWHFDEYTREVSPTDFTGYSDLFNRWVVEQKTRAPYRIVHEIPSAPGERWSVIDRYQYFSVFSRKTETFYAVHRERSY